MSHGFSRVEEAAFARHLVDEGLAPIRTVEAVQARRRGLWRTIGEIAIDCGLLTFAQAVRVLEHQERHPELLFGEAARALGLLEEAHVEALLETQDARIPSLDELLVEWGALEAHVLRAARQRFGETVADATRVAL